MKLKTTNKVIKNGYYHILSIGYCDMAHLLKYQAPFAYNAGVYGWNWDAYEIDNICICTGYRPISSSNTNVNFDLMREYEQNAQNICNNWSIEYDKKVELINALLLEFVNECIK